MTSFRAPRSSDHTPAYRPGAGSLPHTAGFAQARDEFTSAWRSAQRSFVSEIRSHQAGIKDSAEFGAAQLQGFGSTRNYDYVAERWLAKAGEYVVGGGAQRKTVGQGAGGYSVGGLNDWIRTVDREVRENVLIQMDRKLGPWLYRHAFQERYSVSVTQRQAVHKRPDGSVVTDAAGQPSWAPGTERVVERVTTQKAYVGWPVWSGYSLSRLDIEWSSSGKEIGAKVVSRAPYTLAAPATRAVWYRLRRNFRDLIASVGQAVGEALGRIHGRDS